MTARSFALLAGCGAALCGLTVFGLYRQSLDDLDGSVAVIAVQGAIYLAAVAIVRRAETYRGSLVLILIVAAAMRLAALVSPPYLSDDVYRYIWDGRVIGAGINPYRYIPTDPNLAGLRDATIFPEINRGNYAPTIYPPAAQAVFFAVTRISESVIAMKAAMIGFELVAAFVLWRLLSEDGLPSARLLIYAWHPLAVWEFAGSGHIDAALMTFVMLAVWARRRGSGGPAGLALAGAVLVKFYPVVLMPALYRRWNWTMPAGFAAVLVLAYLPFLDVGWRVLGFLPGYIGEEGFANGGGFYLLGLIRLLVPAFPARLYIGLAAMLLAVLAIAIALLGMQDDPVSGSTVLATAFILLLSPHYPWYFVWLIPFACLLPGYSLLWLTAASVLLYLVPVGSHLVRDGHRLLIETAIYLPFAVLALIDWRARRQAWNGTRQFG